MEDEKDAFYVVRKGDIIGVYRSFRECQEQAGSSVTDPAMSVYKGYGWPKAAEEFISSVGIKNALFSMNASYVKDDVFGKLTPCPIQQPSSSLPKRVQEIVNKTSCQESDDSNLYTLSPPQKQLKIESGMASRVNQLQMDTCTIEFDGASKGNPGKAGAGAVIRAPDKSVLFYLREGIGYATNNVAEYRALLLGMKSALKKGFKNVRIQGDSMLVCMQVEDKWKTKHPNMAELCKQAKELKKQFKSFKLQHVEREFNSDADTQANYAIHLAEGETEEIAGGYEDMAIFK